MSCKVPFAHSVSLPLGFLGILVSHGIPVSHGFPMSWEVCVCPGGAVGGPVPGVPLWCLAQVWCTTPSC